MYLVLLQFDSNVVSCCSSVSVVSLASSCALQNVAKSRSNFPNTSWVLLITIKEVAEIQIALKCTELHLQVLLLFCLSVMLEFDGHAGHSLGAGVASLAAPWAALQWPGADIRCVTFGNPKPGNQAYSDVSCHLPSLLLPLGFTSPPPPPPPVSCLLIVYLH